MQGLVVVSVGAVATAEEEVESNQRRGITSHYDLQWAMI
jgi:hypothetical protein